MDTFKTFLEDLASGRPAKKPVSSNLLKQRARENKKALDTGFMKMPDYVKKKFNEEDEYKAHWMYKGDKKVWAKKKEDHDRLNKQGYDHDDPKTKKVEEEKKNCGCGQDPCITYGKKQKVNEVSDALKTRYVHKAMRDVDNKERASQLADKQGAPASVGKSLSKSTIKRRKGIAKARAKLDPPIKESSRDKYNPKVSKMRTKEKMNKVGLPVDSPLVTEASKPTNPALWSRAKAAARSKFDVYPSAYANGWAVQWYKKRGGGWRKGKATKESVELQELSPQTISSYQKKAGKQYSDLKKSTMSATSREGGYHKGYISQKEYDAQHDMADKKARRGKGLAMSKGKGVQKEGAMKRLATDKAEKERLQKRKEPSAYRFPDKDGKATPLYRNMKEEQMQLVTNLDLDESIANLVRRGVGKVKDSLQKAGQQYKDSQEKSMKAGKGIYQNPVSGDNIRKRMKQMQSQKKRLTK